MGWFKRKKSKPSVSIQGAENYKYPYYDGDGNKYYLEARDIVSINHNDGEPVIDYLELGYEFHPDYRKIKEFYYTQAMSDLERTSGITASSMYGYTRANVNEHAENMAKQLVLGQLRYRRLHEVFENWDLQK